MMSMKLFRLSKVPNDNVLDRIRQKKVVEYMERHDKCFGGSGII